MTDLDTKALEAAVLAYDKSPALHRSEECNEVALRAAVSAYLAALNETHALVPREASDSMTEAAQDAADDHFSIDADKGPWLRQDGYKAAWAAMIKAALTAQEPRT